jgi:hypothetical protein
VPCWSWCWRWRLCSDGYECRDNRDGVECEEGCVSYAGVGDCTMVAILHATFCAHLQHFIF